MCDTELDLAPDQDEQVPDEPGASVPDGRYAGVAWG